MNVHVNPAQSAQISPLAVSDPRIRKELQLAGLRFMCTRARWLESEAKLIGIALKSGKITSDEADVKIDELGALDLVYPELMTPVDPVHLTLQRWEAQENRPKPKEHPKPEYRPAQATVDTFLYWIVRQDAATQARWLAEHPNDAPYLRKLWEEKCKAQSK